MSSKNVKSLGSTDKWEHVRKHFYATKPNYEEFVSNHAEHINRHFDLAGEWSPLRNFFFERLSAAEFHWFFVQGIDALMNGLYIPAVSSLLNGIEASLRVTINQVSDSNDDLLELSPYKVLSNSLIKNGKDIGMPVEHLAFSDETDFLVKLESQKPNRMDVELVRHRNNICHGYIFEFINRDLGNENSFFTPVSLRKLSSFELLDVSGNWAQHLGEYRKSKKLLLYTKIKD